MSGPAAKRDPDDAALFDAFMAAVKECKRIGYNPVRFVQMLHERGAVRAAEDLLDAINPSDGFTELYLRGKRLDLSVEYIVLKRPFRGRFSPAQIATAEKRLTEREFGLPAD